MSEINTKSKLSCLGLFLPVLVIFLALYFTWSGDFKGESREISAELAEAPVKNRFEYDFSYLKRVDPALVKFVESASIPLPFSPPYAITMPESGSIFVSAQKSIIEFDSTGVVKRQFNTSEVPSAISAEDDGVLVVAYSARLAVFDLSTGRERVLVKFPPESILTSVAVDSGIAFVADAGLRSIWRIPVGAVKGVLSTGVATGKIHSAFDVAMRVSQNNVKVGDKGELSSINGVPGKEGIERFVIPSPYFDVAIGIDGSLWVANTGRYELDNFSRDGKFRSSWKAPQGGVSGFFGCCNPAHFAIMPNGDFVTAEKGVVRVKIYGPDGLFKCVVAPPSAFNDGAMVTDLAVTPEGDVLVVDSRSNRVRVFKRVGDGVER